MANKRSFLSPAMLERDGVVTVFRLMLTLGLAFALSFGFVFCFGFVGMFLPVRGVLVKDVLSAN